MSSANKDHWQRFVIEYCVFLMVIYDHRDYDIQNYPLFYVIREFRIQTLSVEGVLFFG